MATFQRNSSESICMIPFRSWFTRTLSNTILNAPKKRRRKAGRVLPEALEVRIVLSAVNPPVDGDESVTTPEDTPITGNLLDNGSDPQGLAISVVSLETNGGCLQPGRNRRSFQVLDH